MDTNTKIEKLNKLFDERLANINSGNRISNKDIVTILARYREIKKEIGILLGREVSDLEIAVGKKLLEDELATKNCGYPMTGLLHNETGVASVSSGKVLLEWYDKPRGRDVRIKEVEGKLQLQAYYMSDINPDPESHWLPLEDVFPCYCWYPGKTLESLWFCPKCESEAIAEIEKCEHITNGGLLLAVICRKCRCTKKEYVFPINTMEGKRLCDKYAAIQGNIFSNR